MVNELRHLLRSTSTTKDNRVLWDLGVGQGVAGMGQGVVDLGVGQGVAGTSPGWRL